MMTGLFHAFRLWLDRQRRWRALKRVPYSYERGTDLTYLTESAEYYADMHAAAFQSGAASDQLQTLLYAERVMATWGLIARGAEGIPYALAMLESGDVDKREDGAGILMGIGNSPGVTERLLDRLTEERDDQVRDSLVLALGAMRSRKAIPALAALIEDEKVDGDTRWTAVDSLGKIVRRRFLDREDPLAEALTWIARYKTKRGGARS